MIGDIYNKTASQVLDKMRIFLITLLTMGAVVFNTSPVLANKKDNRMPACEDNSYNVDFEKAKTAPYSDPYNWLAHDLFKVENKVKLSPTIQNGFIIGVEKFASRETRPSDKALYNAHITTYSDKNSSYPDASGVRNFALKKFKIDPKWPVVSHILEYKNRKKYNVLNPYVDAKGGFVSGNIDRSFNQGLETLHGSFANRLRSRLSSGRFTHIIFISMGWFNDQGVSLCRYDNLMMNTKKEMLALNKPFKPLVVGFTWPSVWLSDRGIIAKNVGHIASVFNKANDADEIGVLYGNIILNRLIPQANTKNLPVVAIGHSYGARLMGRAIYSRNLLKQGALNDGPDLALLMQPAYSAQRHMAKKGLEGYPFAPIAGLNTALFITSSKKDRANPIAIWSRHAGGFWGIRKGYQNQNIFRVINQGSGLDDTLRNLPGSKVGVPNIIDATRFITRHGEIYQEKAGRLLARLLNEYTYRR